MLHEIIQGCLADGRWDPTFIDNKTTEIVHAGMESLVRLDINVDTAKAEIRKRAKGLQAFSQRFIGDSPKVSCPLSQMFSVSYIVFDSRMPSLLTRGSLEARASTLPSVVSMTLKKISGRLR